MSLAALQQIAVQTDAPLNEGRMDAHMIRALDRMRDWCVRNPPGQAIMARGFIVDSTKILVDEITKFFPGIDVSPIVDDVALFIAENAQSSGQKIQQVKFHYVADGKRPKVEDANHKTTFKVYADKTQRDTGYTSPTKVLKAEGGGSSGDANQLMAQVTAGLVKFFLLEVTALDITDAKAMDLAVVQALGGNAAALTQAIDAIAGGGADGKAMQAVIDQIVDIKSIRAALTQAGDTPGAASLAAALALKTETLSTTLATLQAPNGVRAEITRGIETVKADLTGRQIEGVVSGLSRALPPIVARAANDSGTRASLNIQVSRAVEALQITARTHDMPVRDMIALTIAKSATPEMTSAVTNLTTLMARPDFLPSIERAVPAHVSAPIRDALTTPVLQATIQAPCSLQPVVQTLKAMGETSGNPTIKMAAIALDGLSQPSVASPILRAPTVQSIAENLQAVSLMEGKTPPAALKLVTAQVEAIAVQMREPAPQPTLAPQALEPQAPLAILAAAVKIPAPERIPPAPAEHKGGEYKTFNYNQPDQPGRGGRGVADIIARGTDPKAPASATRPETARTTIIADAKKTDAADKKEKADKKTGTCKDTCKRGFNCATCGVISEAAVTQMNREVDQSSFRAHRANRLAMA